MKQLIGYFISILFVVCGTFYIVCPEDIKEMYRNAPFNRANWQDKKSGDWTIKAIGIIFVWLGYLIAFGMFLGEI